MTTTGTIINDFATGDEMTLVRTITGLPAPITSAELGIKRSQGSVANLITKDITTSVSASGQITSAGTVQSDGTYRAVASFNLAGDPGGDTSLLRAGVTYWAYVRCLPGPYTSEIFTLVAKSGGVDG